MNRSRQVVKILEGFKLGKLGAGKKKFVEPNGQKSSQDSQKASGIRILRDEANTRRVNGVSVALPRLIWVDTDGFAYSLNMDYRPQFESYILVLLCGKEIVKTNGMQTLWQAWSGYVKEHDAMTKEFEKLSTNIKNRGIAGVTLAQFDIRPFYTKQYQKWLNERRKKKQK
jgi:hypothetical protein